MNNKEIYMTRQDVVNELITKINCDKQFEMLTDYEKKLITQNKIKLFVDELYDLNKIKTNYLSERDTYIVRKLYGVLDSSKCTTGLRIQEELNISNVSSIKSSVFKKINKDLEKTLNDENFNKKRKMFFELFGVDSQIFKLNIFIFNKNISSEILDIDNYIKNTSFQTILEESKEIVIYIKSVEDFKKINLLTEREIEVINLRFGLENNNQCFTTEELANKFNVTRERIRQIESKGLRKISQFYSIKEKSKKFELSGLTSIEELGLSVRSVNCLKRAGIETAEELLTKSREELFKIRNLGMSQIEEIFEKLSIIKKIEINLIKTINLSSRTHHYLIKAGIFTVEELLLMTEEQLIKIVGIGPLQLEEIKLAIRQHNLGKLLEKQSAPKLNVSVDQLNLSPQLKNCLKRVGIFTVEELLSKTEEDLIKFRRFGPVGIKKILDCIDFIKKSNNIEEDISEEKQTLLKYKKAIELESKKSQLLEEEQQIDVVINETNEKLERLKNGDINGRRKK